MVHFFLLFLCLFGTCSADISFGERLLVALFEKWEEVGGCEEATFDEFVRQVLIQKRLLAKIPFTKDSNFRETVEACTNPSMNGSLSETKKQKCQSISLFLQPSDTSSEAGLRFAILDVLADDYELYLILFDSVFKKILGILKSRNVFVLLQNNNEKIRQCIQIFYPGPDLKGPVGELLVQSKTNSEPLFESVFLFLLENFVVFSDWKDHEALGTFFGGSCFINDQGLSGRTVLIHCLSLLNRNKSDLPELEVEIEQFCRTILKDGYQTEHVKIRDSRGISALHMAALKSSDKLCSLLLKTRSSLRGLKDHNDETPMADVNVADENNDTPLHVAISPENSLEADRSILQLLEKQGRENVWKILIYSGANVTLKNKKGDTPLHRAAGTGARSLAELILRDKEPNINELNAADQTALHRACITGDAEMIGFLLAKGARRTVTDVFGNRPIHYASRKASSILMFSDEDLQDVTDAGWSPLHFAVYANNTAVTNELLEKKANVNLQIRSSGKTALMIACENGYDEICRLQLNAPSLDKKSTDCLGRSPLDWACEFGHASVCMLLLWHGFDKQSIRRKAQLLHTASQQGDDMLEVFFDAWGHTLNKVDKNGRTVLQVAKEKHYSDLVKKLRQNFTNQQLGEKVSMPTAQSGLSKVKI